MKILYVTSFMPYGEGETFLIDEIEELLRRNEVLVVPRSPGKLGPHAAWLAPYTVCEKLFSPRVLAGALRRAAVMPFRVAAALRILLRGRSPGIAVANLAVLPKALWLAGVAIRWKAGHIHCHWASANATMAMIASEISGVPWSFTAHRFDIVTNNLLADKARSATLVRAIAEDGLRMMAARKVEPAPNVRVVPMGIRIPEKVRWNRPRTAVVLCPANLLEVKGHRYLIEAWRILRDQGIPAQLWLAGQGELRPALEALVADLRLSGAVTFLGEVKHSTLLGWYKAGMISAVALASLDLGGGLHEGIPVALVEAMSYGIPVVATATGGIPELVRPGAGLLVPPADAAALAQAIRRILEDEPLARTMAESARQWIAETRDISVVVSELEAWFRAGVSRETLAPHC